MTELTIILGLVLVNGFFAMSELALVSSKRARLQVRADEGSGGARAALALLDDPTSFLSSVQVGISLISIVTGVYSGAAIAENFGAWLVAQGVPADYALEVAFALVVVAVTFVSIILGELIPKRIAMSHAEAIAVWVAPVMRAFAYGTAPLVWLLRVCTNAALRLLPVSSADAGAVTEDEVRAMVDEGTRAGVFEPSERRLIDGVLALADRRAASVMVSRQDIVWLDLDEPLPQLWQQAKDSGHSRFLAARGSLDALLGTITLANLSEALRRGHLDLERDFEAPLHVPDGISVLQLLDRFQKSGTHLAVITDEYGDIEGVATPIDILKAIAGELPDAGRDRSEIVVREDGSWLVDGNLPIEALQAALARRDLARPNDYQTAAGFVLWELGRIPKSGDVLSWRDLRIEIVDMDGTRIDKVLVSRQPHAEDPSG